MKAKHITVILNNVEEGKAKCAVLEDESLEFIIPAVLLPAGYHLGDMFDIIIRKSEDLAEEASILVTGLSEKMQ